MERLSDQLNKELNNVLLKDTGFYDTSDNFYTILRNAGIVTVADLLNNDKLADALSHCRDANKKQIYFLVSMIEYKYLGKELSNVKYLSNNFKLNSFDEDGYCHYFEFENGEKVDFWDFFASSKAVRFANLKFHVFVARNKKNYPDGKAPLIDYMRFLSESLKSSNKKSTFNNGYEIVQAYINSYDGVKNVSNESNNYKEELISLKKQLKELTGVRNDLDSKITKLQFRIEQISEESNKVLKK